VCVAALAGVPTAQGRLATASAPARHVAVEEQSILELQAAMAEGRATSKEITAAYLARIAAYDKQGPVLNAMIAMNPRALDEADALDRERATKGPRGPLHGIPVVIKDNYETVDLPTTGGSMALAGFTTGRDAFQVRKLREAGVVVLGKTNLHELAAGIITISSLGGQTRNPYDPARTPGGSSGGSGAAVAASFAATGMASDTCGSIRIPAANNNLFGLRGTQGLSSRTGIIPLSHTQDIGGPLARTVTDLAVVLDATVGEDPDDQTTVASQGHIPKSYRETLDRDALRGVRLGVLGSLFGATPEDEEVSGIVRKAIDALAAQGAEIVEVSAPGLEEMLGGTSLINYEFKSDLAAYLSGLPGAPVRSLQEILDRGAFHAALESTFKLRNATKADPDELRRVTARRAAVSALVEAKFRELHVEALIYPTLRRRPVVVDEPQRGTNCQLSATTGLPAMAAPAGFTADGVPVGFEMLGPAWSEARLLSFAYAYEQAASPRRSPPTTPALVEGHVPRPVALVAGVTGPLASGDRGAAEGVRVSYEYDPVSGRLSYELPPDVVAASLNRATPGPDGPVLHRLVDPASRTPRGAIVLPPYQRTWLVEGALRFVIQTANQRFTLTPHVPGQQAARPQ
jgi:amidase